MEAAPETQTQRTEEAPAAASRRASPHIPVWVWVIVPAALAALAYVQAEPIIVKDSPIVESSLHPWSMACFGLFLGWSLLLNFRDGKWLGLLGAVLWYGLFFVNLMQMYHDYLLSNVPDIRSASRLWLAPGALFALYWLISIFKPKHYTDPQKGERMLPRPLLLLSTVLLVWFLLGYAGAIGSTPRDVPSSYRLEWYTSVGLIVLVGVFIPLVSALRYEWGDGKSLSFCLNLGASYSLMVIFFIGTYLGITDMISDPASTIGVVVMTIFMFILLVAFLVLDAALIAALFLPKIAAEFAVDKASLHKIWDAEPKKKMKMKKAAETLETVEVTSNFAKELLKQDADRRSSGTSIRDYPMFHFYLHPASHYVLGILVVLLGAAFFFWSTRMNLETTPGVVGEQLLVMLAFGTLFLGTMLLFNTYTSRKARRQWLKNALKARTTIANREIVVAKGDESLPEEYQFRQYFLQLEKIPHQLAAMPEESPVLTEVKESQYRKYVGRSSTTIYYYPQAPFTFLLEDEV